MDGVTIAHAGTPPVMKYPKHWTWEKEKSKHYPDGSGRPPWMPPFWFAIAACEQPYGTGTRWTAYSQGYEGAFGFAHSTWKAYRLPGYPSSASTASAWQQYQVALRVYRDVGLGGWGCYTGGGYKYHL